ncbi:MAG: hypothetical protein ACTSPD_20605 [Promethearchaeota archaeon]
MRVLITFNVGSRDIKVKNSKWFPKEQYCTLTKKYWEEFLQCHDKSEFLNKFEFQITESYIKHFLAENIFKHNEWKIVLFGTNQNPQHDQDTYYSGLILKEYIAYFLKKRNIDQREIIVEEISLNPSDLDMMYNYYYNKLKQISLEKYDFVYIGITTGTTAQNSAILLASFNIWEKKALYFYKSIYQEKPTYLRIGDTIFRENLKKLYNSLKNNFQFFAAAELARKFDFSKKEIIEMEIAHYKMSFNFYEVVKLIKDLINTTDLNPNEKSDYVQELNIYERLSKLYENKQYSEFWKELRTKNPLTKDYFEINILLLINLTESLLIKWQLKEYIDFLGRIFRLQEGLLRFCFEIITKVSTDKIIAEIPFDIFEKFKTNQLITDELTVQGFKNSNNNLRDKTIPLKYGNFLKWVYENTDIQYLVSKNIKNLIPNRYVLNILLHKIINNKEKSVKKEFINLINNFINLINKLENLSEMRNKSPIAHDFLPSSKENILNQLNMEEVELINKIRNIKKFLFKIQKQI